MLALRYRHHRTAPIPSKQSEDAPTTTETANHVGPTATTHEKPHRPSIARNAQQTPRQTTQLHHPQPPTYKHITRKTGLAGSPTGAALSPNRHQPRIGSAASLPSIRRVGRTR